MAPPDDTPTESRNLVKRVLTTLAACTFAVATLAGCGSDDGQEAAASPTTPAATATTPAQTDGAHTDDAQTEGSQSFTMAQVAEHNTASSCWTAIEGEVYDVTNWISQHPGGPDKIQGLCGTDGTATFQGQHSDAPNPNERLATFKIGTLEG
ncbi:hypothetical protein KILIM_021_00460 [Kineosphaera limosa NBRC 100340]|uniref:Cytochrome b5 heme-binding domain-containing protein n=1 Tax=Kineosphaera limosa NBRC 100340 TaxID=1184609 RepID=K6WNV9_9MICO|nr:hypothetical protein KILIM_021_00460 [Kineosphaera limosa NBRC 100340]